MRAFPSERNFISFSPLTLLLGEKPRPILLVVPRILLVPRLKSLHKKMVLDFFVWQSAEGDGNLHQVVEPERTARRKKIRSDSLQTFKSGY